MSHSNSMAKQLKRIIIKKEYLDYIYIVVVRKCCKRMKKLSLLVLN